MGLITFGKFKRVFRELVGHPLETSDLSKRIIIQKIAYLVFRKGILPATYPKFSWYIHGTFSRELWKHTLLSADNEEEISPDIVDSIQQFKGECETHGVSSYFDNSDKMELITTILYIAGSQNNLNADNQELIDAVKKAKDKFEDDEIKEAISKLKEINWNFEN